MSNPELVRTTSLKGKVAARLGGTDLVKVYGQVIEKIRQQCGNEVASLFAEPAQPPKPEPDDPQLTWYTSLKGQMIELSSLDEMTRQPVVAKLRDRLEKLRPILLDPQLGPTVASWLYVTSPTDILSVGGDPVLINYSYIPQDIAISPSKRDAHFAETIGRYISNVPTPPFTAQEAASYSLRNARTPRDAAVVAETSPPVAQAPVTETGSGQVRSWAPIVATAIAAIVLVVLLIPGVLIYPSQANRKDIQRQEELLSEDNKGLGDRLRELQDAAKQRVCRAPNGQLTPLAPLPGQTQTPPSGIQPRADLLPPPPNQIQVPRTPGAPPGSPVVMNDLIDQAVVFVMGRMAGHPEMVDMGTGFFVAPDRIVTNRHVIENIDPGTLLITNKKMGHAVSARVVAKTEPPPDDNLAVQDFALLGVEQPGLAVVKLGPSIEKSAPVVAAGYPGFLVTGDPGYLQLVRGNQNASPDNTIQSGIVIQKRDSDPVKLVTHSANLGRGNSGGPLLDLCSRVVGVNTAVLNEGKLATTANFAQDVTELKAFLAANGVTPQMDETQMTCPPAVAQATPPANAPPAAPAPAARR
jgi:S1-C subfamily serine protease